MKIRVGIFFGGSSRERERSFASGRSAYENLNRSIFLPIPIFVTSDGTLIRWEEKELYKKDLRYAYPPFESLPPSPHAFRIYEESLGVLEEKDLGTVYQLAGTPLDDQFLATEVDVALLTLPDAALYQRLARTPLPCIGAGPETAGMGDALSEQRKRIEGAGFQVSPSLTLDREDWLRLGPEALYRQCRQELGFPVYIRPDHQPGGVGAALMEEGADPEVFAETVHKAFFREIIPIASWRRNGEYDKTDHIRLLTDLEYGLGFPLRVSVDGQERTLVHPEDLLNTLDAFAQRAGSTDALMQLESRYGESAVLLEASPAGLGFACLVARREDLAPVAMPPVRLASVLSGHEGRSEPSFEEAQIHAIRRHCERLYEQLDLGGFACLYGTITPEADIFFDRVDPILALSAPSPVFSQLAEIGLNASEALTFLIATSLRTQAAESPENERQQVLIRQLEDQLDHLHMDRGQHTKVAVLMGGKGDASNRSLYSGRRVFELLAALPQYDPVALWLKAAPADGETASFIQLPPALLQAHPQSDLSRAIEGWRSRPAEEIIRDACREVTLRYGSPDAILFPDPISLHDLSDWIDIAFICCQGSPGEDGKLQQSLEEAGLPFTGPSSKTAQLTADTFHTLTILRRNGLEVPDQLLISKDDYLKDPEKGLDYIESEIIYPFYAAPAGERESAATRIINNREELDAYLRFGFRSTDSDSAEYRYRLRLRPNIPFPQTDRIVLSALITARGAEKLLKTATGFITLLSEDGTVDYQPLPPSEMLSENNILSLREKYLAAGWPFITPARFDRDPSTSIQIRKKVLSELESAARILNLEGCFRIDALVRIYEPQRVEVILTEVQAIPAFLPDNPLFHQAREVGRTGHDLIDQTLRFTLARAEQQPPSAPVESSLPEETEEQGPVAVPAYAPETKAVGQPPNDRLFDKTSPTFGMTMRRIFENTLKFIKSPFFLKNFGLMLGFFLVLFLLVQLLLKLYTHHGESLQVHDYVGMTLEEAENKARSRSFRIVISDSVFMVDQPAHIVLEQYPEPFSRVKENRRIYLSITSKTAPLVRLPELQGSYNYEQYERKLLRLGINPSILERQFDNKLEENTILYLVYDGEKITENDLRRGVKIPKGSEVGFVVTERLSNQVPIPNLVCQRYSEATFIISASNLVLGAVYGAENNRGNAYVVRQEPEPGQMIEMGESINIYLSDTRPANCPEEPIPPVNGFEQNPGFEEQ